VHERSRHGFAGSMGEMKAIEVAALPWMPHVDRS
jgi:hypothetical protein